MTDITLYIDGTADFTSGSAAVVGHGTLFTSLINGDPILAPDGHWYELTITDDTDAVLDRPYIGSTVAGAEGGTAWVIFKSSISRDSTRTASMQLSSITSLYRNILNLTGTDQITTLTKAGSVNNAGVLIQQAATQLFQAGSFTDDDFSIRYLLASTWTKALGISSTTGAMSVYSQLLFGNIISPPQLTATTDDFAPAGVAQANVIRVNTDTTRTLTGIAGGAPGRVVCVMNVGANSLAIETEGGTSQPANRFTLSANMVIPTAGSVLIIYDGPTSRWLQLAGSSSGAGTGPAGGQGWSPVLGYVSNGSGGIVAQIVSWTGGQGTPPTSGAYIGATGEVSTAAAAINIQGPQGAAVQFQLDLTRGGWVQWSYVGTIAWTDLLPFGAIAGPPATLEWNFSTATADADPGASAVAFNSATFSSITELFFDKLERYGSDVSAWISTWDNSSSLPNRGFLSLIDSNSPGNYALFMITGATVSSGNYFKVQVTPITGVIPPNGDRIAVIFIRAGDKGIPGLIPRGTYSTTTSYLVGDVVVGAVDGSSYISLIQPNLNNAITSGGSNLAWALFAQGVGTAFLTSINLTLANATAQATNSAASATASAASATTATTQAGISTAEAGISTTQATASAASATSAAASATTAATQATTSTTQAGISTSQAGNSATSATAAATSATTATTQAGAATTQAATATTQAGIATTQAVTATTEAGVATTQAGIATTQASTATTQASIAATQATNAAASATTATTQATAAVSSATMATTGASTATIQAGNAATSATAAATSATAAASSATASAGSASGAAATLTSFNNIYLGTFSSAPTVNNTGGALVDGNMYFNTGGALNIWNGSAWLAYTPSSGTVVSSVFGRSGSVVAVSGDYTFAQIGATPTSIAGYGIADTLTNTVFGRSGTVVATAGDYTFAQLGSAPTTLSGYGITDAVNVLSLGAANGVATLDGSGKLTTAQIPTALVGAVQYQGTWNASTNSPALASSTGTKGFYYKVSTAGVTSIDGTATWSVNDTIIFDGAIWDKIDGNTNEVLSVFGRTGVVAAASNDYTFAQIGSKPTSIVGYGIVDSFANTVFGRSGAVVATAGDYTFAQLASKPTTIAGYGITDTILTLGTTGTTAAAGNDARITGAAQAANNLSDLSAKNTAFDNLSVHGADISASSTVNLDSSTGSFVHITGNTGINAITLTDGRRRTVYFTGTPLLTASASLVLLNGTTSYQVAAGDIAVFIADGSTVRCAELASATVAAARLLLGLVTVASSGSAGDLISGVLLDPRLPGFVARSARRSKYVTAFTQ